LKCSYFVDYSLVGVLRLSLCVCVFSLVELLHNTPRKTNIIFFIMQFYLLLSSSQSHEEGILIFKITNWIVLIDSNVLVIKIYNKLFRFESDPLI
jgi:hypothetical protein